VTQFVSRSVGGRRMKIGWLIESESEMWIGVGAFCTLGWVSNHDEAIRFSRRIDAERAMEALKRMGIGFHEQCRGAVDHGFYDENDDFT
jgi:hypothetical protein